MKIAIASGKGGTGKTTVSVLLYHFLSKKYDNKVQLIDCDVEEPNDLLFFGDAKNIKMQNVFSIVPEIDLTKCTFCKKCAEWCEFNAISLVKSVSFAEVDTNLCHSCGACFHACDYDALKRVNKPLGTISHFDTGWGHGLIEGRLEIGSAMQTSLIKKVKKCADDTSTITLFDAPPGTSCPVVETVSDADFIILVTEPTPFGLHDMKITVELLNELQKPFGVIVNKANLGDEKVYDFLSDNGIDLLGEIPFSRSFAEKYSKGELIKSVSPELSENFEKIISKISEAVVC